MTEDQIATMQADMRAGTPGDWELAELTTLKLNGDEELDSVEVSGGGFHIHGHDLGYDDGPVDAAIYANARRIARVPLMERTITAQAVENAKLAWDFDVARDAHDAACVVSVAQAAEIKLLLAALLECQAELDAYSRQEYPLDHPVHDRYRKRDFDANPARIAIAQLKEPKP
jgi:hypothetical protein